MARAARNMKLSPECLLPQPGGFEKRLDPRKTMEAGESVATDLPGPPVG